MSISGSGGHLLTFRRTGGRRNGILERHAGEQIGDTFGAANVPPALLGSCTSLNCREVLR